MNETEVSLSVYTKVFRMNPMSYLIFTLNVIVTASVGVSGISHRKMEFSLITKKNETGHYINQFSVQQTGRDLPEVWKVNLVHEITESEELGTSNLAVALTVPPKRPADYKLIHGIGYYKFHNEIAQNFDDALEICSKEGGHLAIINSDEESNALKELISGYVFIGFHDRLKEGEFITIFGLPIKDAGFQKWHANYEPNGGTTENCGSLHPNGGLNDINCDSKVPFICEFDLTWIDG